MSPTATSSQWTAESLTNQSTKKLTKGRLLHKAQDFVSCQVKPFLPIKSVTGTEKQCIINYCWGYAYTNKLVILAEDLDMSRLGAIATGGRTKPSGNLFFVNKTLPG
jgi:hypothetical protein